MFRITLKSPLLALNKSSLELQLLCHGQVIFTFIPKFFLLSVKQI